MADKTNLYKVSTHQRNYAKIVTLRNSSKALDQQIRDTLILLTNTRRSLLDTPSTTFPDHINPVSYSELLSYARRISKFTLPFTYRESEIPSADTDLAAGATPKESKSEVQTNGTTIPVTITNGVDKDVQMGGTVTAMDIDGATPSNGAGQPSQETTTTSLPQDYTQYLDSAAAIPFIPWPTEETIRRGALASIQVLLDKGIDPNTFDPEKGAELEAERKRIADEEDRLKEEQKLQIEENNRREMDRRVSIGGSTIAQNRPEPHKVFQLDELDEDDSE